LRLALIVLLAEGLRDWAEEDLCCNHDAPLRCELAFMPGHRHAGRGGGRVIAFSGWEEYARQALSRVECSTAESFPSKRSPQAIRSASASGRRCTRPDVARRANHRRQCATTRKRLAVVPRSGTLGTCLHYPNTGVAWPKGTTSCRTISTRRWSSCAHARQEPRSKDCLTKSSKGCLRPNCWALER
jgi:hypothetical protein